MSGGEAVSEELLQIDLSAGSCQSIEIKVVDVNIALSMSFCVCRLKDVHLIVFFCGYGTILEHSAHGCIAVYICVFALYITVFSGAEGKLVEYTHQISLHLA